MSTGIWSAYRHSPVEVHPPDRAPFRFAVEDGPTPPPSLTFAVITAWNPRSVKRSEAENRRANRELAAIIDALGLERWDSINSPDDAHREESFAVLGLPREQAIELAARHQQLAIYYVEAGRAELIEVQ